MDDLFIDQTCLAIAKYLQEELNRKSPNLLIVKSIRSFDAISVPLQDFPLLKVYRRADIYKRSVTTRTSNLVAAYGLVMPYQESLAPIMNWISVNVNELLVDSEYRLNMFVLDESKSVEYRTTMNELNQPVYSFLHFNFSIKESMYN